ncbi:MAG TPA: folylpolyglutamate synthase/dihydrofolate synthase family protein [Opitutaceae bacterium]|nr:folylpolyglutamate synthase/dihydrofolate synthase family protein [Opitutaceae bacterium]
MNYREAVEYLQTLKSRGVSLGLDRMRRFMDALGNPQSSVPCIHIAGTNGKGSVAAMLESILRTAGWRVGLYTSPHLVRLAERVQVNRRLITEDELAGYVAELRPIAAQLEATGGAEEHPSYFEFMTALALRHFARSQCSLSCIETGLGGRLDATNVVVPEVSVITSIGLDHCEILGGTISEIAVEKAGIIKSGRPLVLGHVPPEAEAVIRRIAVNRDARVLSVAREFGDGAAAYPRTNLQGDYQRWNAGAATLAARALPPHWGVTDAVIERALMTVDWPARWQRFSVDARRVILDTSHNAEGAEVLDANLTRLVAETGRAPIMIAGVLGEARARPLIEVFCRHAREIHFVVPGQSRACSFEELAALVPPTYRGRVLRGSIAELFPSASSCTVGYSGDFLVVAGSIYLAGEVLARLDPRRGPHEGHLQDF